MPRGKKAIAEPRRPGDCRFGHATHIETGRVFGNRADRKPINLISLAPNRNGIAGPSLADDVDALLHQAGAMTEFACPK